MNKSNIRVFGEISIAHVEKRGLNTDTILFVQCIPENITQQVITYWLLTL